MELLLISVGSIIIGYIMGRMAAKPIVINTAEKLKASDPGDTYEGKDEWEETMNKEE